MWRVNMRAGIIPTMRLKVVHKQFVCHFLLKFRISFVFARVYDRGIKTRGIQVL